MTLEALPAGNYQVAVGATRRAQPEGELSTTIYSAAQPTLKQRVGLHRPAGLASARLNDRLDLANHCDTMLLNIFRKRRSEYSFRVLLCASSVLLPQRQTLNRRPVLPKAHQSFHQV